MLGIVVYLQEPDIWYFISLWWEEVEDDSDNLVNLVEAIEARVVLEKVTGGGEAIRWGTGVVTVVCDVWS
jgi:hypothetical protein